MAFIILHLRDHLKVKTPKYILSDFHRQLCWFVKFSRVGIAAPRNFAKSSFFSFFYALYCALEQKKKILLVSATGALAEHWLAIIRRELEMNPSIHKRFGDVIGDKWTNEELKLTNGSVILAKGAEKQIRGFRPDVIIGDDLETDEIVVSQERRKKFDNWFWTDLVGTLNPDGQLVVIGTILHPESFLAELINHGRHNWKTELFQAIKNDGESLWPDRWPIEALLERKKEMGDSAFAQEYQNDPLPDEFKVFQEKWIKYYDKEPNCVYFCTVDPAIALDKTSDYTGFIVAGVDSQDNIYVVEAVRKRLLPDETIDYIFSIYERWNTQVIAIESQGFQKMLKLEVEKQRRKRNLYPIIKEVKSEGKRKFLRIESLQPRFQAGQIFIKPSMEDLKTELLRFPSPRCHDDLIDALAYLPQIARPATKDITRINPNCFLAEWERSRKNSEQTTWGDHKTRDIIW